MSVQETEWESLASVWQSETVDGARLRRTGRVYRYRLLITVAIEIAILAASAALTVFVVGHGPAGWQIVWLATIWFFATIAVAFSVWNRHGTWTPIGESVAEYVRLSRLRCERQRRSIRFVIVLFIAEAVAIVAQLAWFDRLTPLAIVLLWTSGAIIAGWCVTTSRRIQRELDTIARFEQG